jgi:capsular exopolysaccharide synthesis family protein
VKNEDDLNDYPLLTAVPFDKVAVTSPLITQVDKYSVRVEAFRLLRTNLQFLSPENPPKVISVASAMPGEGKTTTATNLAISLVLAGFKVILLECDLRRPRVALYLGAIKSNKGISEIISSRTPIPYKKFLQGFYPLPSSTLRLDFLSSGAIPPNPSELLNSNRFQSLINSVARDYDYVIVDAPPILPVSDSSIIATLVDGVLMVVHAGTTKNTQFRGAVDAIINVSSKVLGVALNMIPPDSRRAQDYGYKYGYSGEYKSHYGYSYNYGYGKDREVLAYAPQVGAQQRVEFSVVMVKIFKSFLKRRNK